MTISAPVPPASPPPPNDDAETAALRLFIENAPTAIAMVDRGMRYMALSGRWRLDYRLGDLPVNGRSHYEVFPEIPERWREIHRRALAGEVVRADADRFDRADGTTHWLRWEVRPWRRADGEVGGIVLFTEDITSGVTSERAMANREAHLAAVLDTAVDAIVTIDERGMIDRVNPAVTRLFGYAADELVGRNVAMLMPERYAVEHDGYLARYLGTGEKRIIGIGREVVGRRKDGNTFPVELAVAEITGPPRRFVGFVRDITERKELETRFLRAQRLESVGTLVSGIAHDLNNVLTPVLMAVKLLQKDRPGLNKADLLSTARASVERGAGMIRQLLTFSGGVSGERVPVHLKPLLTEVTDLLEHALPKSITVRREWSEAAEPVVGDPTQLAQVLMNLCVNARDAMPDGGTLTLSLAVTTLDARTVAQYPGAVPGRYLILSVADTGTGIPPAVQEKMFDPFFTTKPHGQGTGLGLSTVLGIVKSHGGFVNVYSEPDRGTKMCVYLPAAEPAGGATGVSARPGPAAGHGECVLVVDDEPAIVAMAKATLEAHGYRVLTACGGAEAIAALHAHRSEVRAVLVDMMMPEVDGPAVMAAIRRESPDVPILAASGLRPTGWYAAAIAAAQARFVPKPYSDDELLAAVGERLAQG